MSLSRGTSNGNGLPRYEFSHGYGDGGPILEALDEMYCQGLYGTRSVGQVRDMVFARIVLRRNSAMSW